MGCLLDNKGALMRMFTSNEWTSSQNARTRDGKHVENVVMDSRFWKNVAICFKGAHPLIKVLRFGESDEQPAMGFIYEEMDRAKEKIQSAFKGVKKSYMPLWDIIDERWDKQLHRPLHAAAYYLNSIIVLTSKLILKLSMDYMSVYIGWWAMMLKSLRLMFRLMISRIQGSFSVVQ